MLEAHVPAELMLRFRTAIVAHHVAVAAVDIKAGANIGNPGGIGQSAGVGKRIRVGRETFRRSAASRVVSSA
jgi:hypothetical protein